MINLNIVFLLVVGLAVAYAWKPNCTNCKYYNGIGFVKDDTYCAVYYVCYKNPYSQKHRNSTIKYEYKVQCCPDGLVWDEEHLTCIWKKWGDDCNTTRYKCPKIPTTTNLPCPYTKVPGDKTKYFVKHTHQIRMCPYGEVWHEDNCTCYFGKDFRPRTCDKLLHFDFNHTFDSDSCYNFAKGDPYGDAYISDDALCVNGSGMVSIGFLNNWWAWNPIGKKFTICFWFRPYSLNDQGIVSLNCEHDTYPGSVLEACIKGHGNLWIQLGTFDYDFGPATTAKYTKVCVTYHHGEYMVFVDGVKVLPLNHDKIIKDVKPPPNAQVATTLGYVKKWPGFRGYIDDFCFWIRVLSDAEIAKCFHKGRSVKG